VCSSDLTYPDFQNLKIKLNKKKHELDKYNTPENAKSFSYITRNAYSYSELCGNNGMLVKEYNAEIVTNAWLKMYECMKNIDDLLKSCNTVKRDFNQNCFNTLHIAEAPGNFILSINHYLHSHYPKINWNWLASTYRDIHDNNQTYYLQDSYNIIKQYNNNWTFGCDGDGDITSANNILDFRETVLKKFNTNLANFVTSDVKYVPKNNNFDEEENINKPVHFGQILTGLYCLKPGGALLLKELTMFESSTISYLYLLACVFKQVHILKPVSSKSANSEVYVLCKNYTNNLTQSQLNKLLNIMRYIRILNTENGSPAIFKQADIPVSFINNLLQIVKELTAQQITGIDNMIDYYTKKRQTTRENRQKICQEWIQKNKVTVLNNTKKIISRKV